MGKQVLIVNASPRKGGNSERLAKEFAKGAEEAGHQVKTVCLTGKTLNFCRGCLACQASGTGHCVMRDDADAIVQEMRTAQVLVFSTPIYFYEMCGQLKTLLDRTNPLFPVEYGFSGHLPDRRGGGRGGERHGRGRKRASGLDRLL